MTPLLRTERLTCQFDGLVAVDSVSLQVEAGGVHGIIGPNGAGKTTLLNVISGYIRQSNGTIFFDGDDLGTRPPEQRARSGIRRTFQNLRLFRQMTAIENVMVGMHADTASEIIPSLTRTKRQRQEERDIAERSNEALDFVGLAGCGEAIAGSLPYGHQRLLEIARAFVAKPKLILLDEPAAGLNSAEEGRLVGLIRRMHAAGVTIILVEHHMEVVMPVCDHITVLNYGKTLADGPPAYIRDHPSVIQAYLGTKSMAARAKRRLADETSHAAH